MGTASEEKMLEYEKKELIDINVLRPEIINWIKEINYVINCYEGKVKIDMPNKGGAFWETKEGKRFQEFDKLGIICFTDEMIYVEGLTLLEHIFNVEHLIK